MRRMPIEGATAALAGGASARGSAASSVMSARVFSSTVMALVAQAQPGLARGLGSRFVAGIGVAQHAKAGVVAEHAAEALGRLLGAVGHRGHTRGDAAALVDSDQV